MINPNFHATAENVHSTQLAAATLGWRINGQRPGRARHGAGRLLGQQSRRKRTHVLLPRGRQPPDPTPNHPECCT
jgi:hypothetical protein